MKRVDYYIFGFAALNIFLVLQLVNTVAFSVIMTTFNFHNPSVLLMMVSTLVCVVLALDTLSRVVAYIGGKDASDESAFLYRIGFQTLGFMSFFAIFILLNGYHTTLLYKA